MESSMGEISVKMILTSILLMQCHIVDIKTGLMIFLAATGDNFQPRQLCFEYILCFSLLDRSAVVHEPFFKVTVSFPCFRMSSDGSAIIHKLLFRVTVSFALLVLG